MAFREGDRVEVCSNQEGFVGSCYVATVVKKLDRNSYAVQYDDLVEEEGMSKKLVETVSVDEMRPVPPRFKLGNGFSLYDKVDVFDNDGWWAGRVTKKIGDMYLVYFPTTGDEMPYHVSRLRVHLDWINRNWIFSKKRCNRSTY